MRLAPLLAAFLTVSAAFAAPPPDFQKRVAALAGEGPGGVVAAWVDDAGTVYAQAGTRSKQDARPLDADTPIAIGSVTKVFTALLLAETQLQGKARLDDPAARYLLPAGATLTGPLASITLETLSTHQSGLPRLPFNLGPNPDGDPQPYARYDRAAMVVALREDGARALAARHVTYSNFGVGVLGEALAGAWGTSYEEALQARVLEPLRLRHTRLLLEARPDPEVAPAHPRGVERPNWTFQAMAPAGALRSTARDLARFVRACVGLDETPLRAAIDLTLKPRASAPEQGGQIGLGWFLSGEEGKRVANHGGATAGATAFVLIDPAGRRGVVLLANQNRNLERLGFDLLDVTPPRPERAKVADADTFAGRYPLNPAFNLDITAREGALFVQATGQSALPLQRLEPDRFKVVGVPAEIAFERNGGGEVVALVIRQNGRDQRGERRPLPAPPKQVALPDSALAEYVGKYPLNPSFVLTVTHEPGQLHVQATGQPKFPVFASAKDHFHYTVVEAKLVFERDAAGKVVAVVLHQNGAKVRGERRD